MTPRILPFFFPNYGCPGRCSYCDQEATVGEAFNMAPPDELVRQVLEAASRTDGRALEIALFGGTFTALPPEVQQRYLEPAAALLDRGMVQGIRVSTHPLYVTPDSLGLLHAYGVKTIELGIQSFADEALRLNGRRYDREQAREACRTVMDGGFDLVVQLMPMLPGALAADDIESARETAHLAPAGVRLFPTVVLEGTALAGWWRERRYVAATVEQAAQRVAEMLEPIDVAGIPVLRIGLQTSERADGAVLAGPYHPALGELCWGALLVRLLERALRPRVGGAPVPLSVEPSLASHLTGHGRAGLRALEETLGPAAFELRLEEAQPGDAGTVWNGGKFTIRATADGLRVQGH